MSARSDHGSGIGIEEAFGDGTDPAARIERPGADHEYRSPRERGRSAHGFGNGRPAVEPLLVRPAEAAMLLGIGKRKLWELTNARVIPYVRVGRPLRYSPAALRAWVEREAKGARK
ncbi:MAG: helix-turn-helix domain-containing protein [Planctomycetota bacterium]